MIITLDTDVINAMDLSVCNPIAPYFFDFCGQEHYRLLCYLSTQFNDTLFVDIGTNSGDSALAMGFNQRNKVVSFDVIRYNYYPISNCRYIIGDFRGFHTELLESRCMLYDIPHSGDMFVKWCRYLGYVKWDGFLILDDYTYDPVKARDWEKLGTRYTKINASKYGHCSGTGIVNFSKTIEFKLK